MTVAEDDSPGARAASVKLVQVFLGLGSNLGDRAANLGAVVERFQRTPGCEPGRLSPIYETEPLGPVPQGWFLNAVMECHVSLAPHALLRLAKSIEAELGRRAGARWGPRVVDIDLLLYGDEQIATDDLVIPHAELWNRRFVLAPLLDVLAAGSLANRVRTRLGALPERPLVRAYSSRMDVAVTEFTAT